MTFRLLSCDGGGIRGYMSSLIIERLQDASDANLISDHIDGFSGTSTGGLVSIALATGTQPSDLVNIYRNRADEIFQVNTLFDSTGLFDFSEKMQNLARKKLLSLMEATNRDSGPGILESQYVADGLVAIANELVGTKTMADIPKSKVLAVNSAALQVPGQMGWHAATFSNQNLGPSPLSDTPDVALADVALATSAAPTYFPPHRVKTPSTDYGFFADGGVFANNPVMNGIEVAISSGLADLNEVEVISIGTGSMPVGIDPATIGDPLDWGILEWFGILSDAPSAALLQLSLAASADNQTRIANNLLKDRIIRLDPALTTAIPLDGYSEDDYDAMLAAVDLLTTDTNPDWVNAVSMAKSWAAKTS